MKNNWNFVSDITTWETSQVNNGKLQVTNFYNIFCILCTIIIINNIYWDTIYILDILHKDYPFPLFKMLFFLFMETAAIIALIGMMYRRILTKLGLFGSIYCLTYLMLHHYTDIMSCRSIAELAYTILIYTIGFTPLFLIIIYRGLCAVFTNNNSDNLAKTLGVLRIVGCIIISFITYYIIEFK